MPNSFARFLDGEELKKVRAVYLQSLEELGTDPADQSTSTPADDSGSRDDRRAEEAGGVDR